MHLLRNENVLIFIGGWWIRIRLQRPEENGHDPTLVQKPNTSKDWNLSDWCASWTVVQFDWLNWFESKTKSRDLKSAGNRRFVFALIQTQIQKILHLLAFCSFSTFCTFWNLHGSTVSQKEGGQNYVILCFWASNSSICRHSSSCMTLVVLPTTDFHGPQLCAVEMNWVDLSWLECCM